MAMEMNKLWEASDFKALTKRLHFACGSMSANDTPTPYEKQEHYRLAEACEIYLKFYSHKPDDQKK